MNQVAIGADRLSCSRRGRRTLDKASFSVAAGRVLAVAGPADSGKNALLNVLAGLAEPDDGAALILGEPAFRMSPALACERCSLVRGYEPPREYTLEMLADLQSDVSPRFERTFLADACKEASIEMGVQVTKLAPAQKAWALTALTLATGARVQLFDGPAIGMDAPQRSALYRLMRSHLTRLQATAVVSVDAPDNLDDLADDLLVLARGRTMLHLPLSSVIAQVREVELPPDGRFAETGAMKVLAARWSTGRRIAWVWCPDGEAAMRETLDASAAVRNVDMDTLYQALTWARTVEER